MQNPPIRKYARSEPTRHAILQAAGTLFSERGYHGVGMRDIAAEADVSLRMANYHFGTKAGLFAACTRLAINEGVRLPAIFEDKPDFADRAAALRKIREKVNACFTAFYGPNQVEWHGGIIFRAMIEGCDEAFDAFWDGMQVPRKWFFAALPQARKGMSPQQMSAWHATLWAQIAFYFGGKRAILRAANRKSYDQKMITAASEHLNQVLTGLLK
jgi:AcrR family transcriptional regulator